MPVMEMAQAIRRRQAIIDLVKHSGIWSDGVHSGTIPGTEKPALLKPGAELLCNLFGLSPRFVLQKSIEDWTGAEHGGEPLFYYHYTCELWYGDYFVAEADGSCNSWEGRYRWRWVTENEVPPDLDKSLLKKRGGKIIEFEFAIDKAETTGKYGKPAAYWKQFKDAIANGRATQVMRQTKQGTEYPAWEIDATLYRIPNDDIFAQANTIKKQAQKRAFVAVTLIGCTASELFTQDMEDLIETAVVDGTARVLEDESPSRGQAPAPSSSRSPQASSRSQQPLATPVTHKPGSGSQQ
jgi:hypothetical protein